MREVHLHVRRYAVEELPAAPEALAGWLRERFEEKDARLDRFYSRRLSRLMPAGSSRHLRGGGRTLTGLRPGGTSRRFAGAFCRVSPASRTDRVLVRLPPGGRSRRISRARPGRDTCSATGGGSPWPRTRAPALFRQRFVGGPAIDLVEADVVQRLAFGTAGLAARQSGAAGGLSAAGRGRSSFRATVASPERRRRSGLAALDRQRCGRRDHRQRGEGRHDAGQ
jgi:hypothetical protein